MCIRDRIYSFRVLDLFNEQRLHKGTQRKYPIHIKLETGMHRLGFKADELIELKQKLNTMNVEVKSIFSHLSSADDENEKDYTMDQILTFSRNSEKLMEGLQSVSYTHLDVYKRQSYH